MENASDFRHFLSSSSSIDWAGIYTGLAVHSWRPTHFSPIFSPYSIEKLAERTMSIAAIYLSRDARDMSIASLSCSSYHGMGAGDSVKKLRIAAWI